MAADNNSVKYDPNQTAGQLNDKNPGACEPKMVQPGITWSEFIARVGDLKMPGDGFADDLEAVQAEQGIAEMPKWPD